MWTKRGKACLILIFSTNTNCENMAYRSFRSEKCSARGVRKVTTGMTTRPGHSSRQCPSPTRPTLTTLDPQGCLACVILAFTATLLFSSVPLKPELQSRAGRWMRTRCVRSQETIQNNGQAYPRKVYDAGLSKNGESRTSVVAESWLPGPPRWQISIRYYSVKPSGFTEGCHGDAIPTHCCQDIVSAQHPQSGPLVPKNSGRSENLFQELVEVQVICQSGRSCHHALWLSGH